MKVAKRCVINEILSVAFFFCILLEANFIYWKNCCIAANCLPIFVLKENTLIEMDNDRYTLQMKVLISAENGNTD